MSNKTRCYEIAGIPVALTGEAEHFFEDDGILAGFRDDSAEPAWVYSLGVCDELAASAGELCATEPGFCVVRSGEDVLTYFGAAAPEEPGVYAVTQRTPEISTIRYLRTDYIRQISPKQALRCMELPHLLAVNDGILLHCSWIRWKDRGILFTAPSGTGKSTQAQLWCDLMGAELINGQWTLALYHPFNDQLYGLRHKSIGILRQLLAVLGGGIKNFFPTPGRLKGGR